MKLEWYPWCVTRLYHVICKSMDIIVRFRVMARLKNMTFVKRLDILLRTVRSGKAMESDSLVNHSVPPCVGQEQRGEVVMSNLGLV